MSKYMRLLLLLFITVVALAACGGGESSGATAENLKARAEDFGAAIMEGNYSEVYDLASPESQSRCSKEEYVAEANAALMSEVASTGLDEDATPKTAMRALFGINEDLDIEVRASDVEVTGNTGSVLIEFYIDDVIIGTQGGDDDIWVLADGQWYLGGAIGSDAC